MGEAAIDFMLTYYVLLSCLNEKPAVNSQWIYITTNKNMVK
jgi:hypothetical protein